MRSRLQLQTAACTCTDKMKNKKKHDLDDSSMCDTNLGGSSKYSNEVLPAHHVAELGGSDKYPNENHARNCVPQHHVCNCTSLGDSNTYSCDPFNELRSIASARFDGRSKYLDIKRSPPPK